MPTGTVKWYDPTKGFGFIVREGGGDDLFVHRSATGPAGLQEGDTVEFAVGYGQKGEQAVDVRVTEPSALPPRPAPAFGARAGQPGGWGSRPVVDVAGLPLLSGVVRRYDPQRGFGFIRRDDAGGDVFFHRTVADAEPVEGDAVEFRLGDGPRGPRAEAVRRTNAAFGGGARAGW